MSLGPITRKIEVSNKSLGDVVLTLPLWNPWGGLHIAAFAWRNSRGLRIPRFESVSESHLKHAIHASKEARNIANH